MTRRLSGILTAAVLAACLAPASARAEEPDEPIACVLGVIRPFTSHSPGLTKFLCKGTFTLPSFTPQSVQVIVNEDVPGGVLGGVVVQCTGLGNPAGSRGYKCENGLPGMGINWKVFLKPSLIRGILKIDLLDTGYPPIPSGNVRVTVRAFTLGTTDSKRYCARFTLPVTNVQLLYKSKTAPPPAGCSPSGASTSTSTSTTTLPLCGDGAPPSCGGTCPAGQICAVNTLGPQCQCFPDGSQACGDSVAPVCNGTCPAGEHCGADSDFPPVALCFCVPDGLVGCGDQHWPTCDGACPSGQACAPQRVSVFLFCNCVAAP